MATYSYSTATSTIHRWTVPAEEPWGAAAEEIAKAWGAAETTYRSLNSIPKDTPLFGNALSFHADDDAVVIAFTVESTEIDGSTPR